MRGSLASLVKCLRFFRKLSCLRLRNLNLDESDLCGLLESCSLFPNLLTLILDGFSVRHAVTSIVPHITKLPKLKNLCLNGTNYSKVDHEYFKKAV